MTTTAELRGLGGRRADPQAMSAFDAIAPLPRVLFEKLTTEPILGLRFSLSASADLSGLGVRMQWMNVAEMISEASEAYPGRLATMRGYIPIGTCLFGSGDPYFFRTIDGAVVRIPHDASVGAGLNESLVELVANSIDAFIDAAEVSAP